MSEIKNTAFILDAIDQLRRRKARPDRTRICHYVSRRYAINSRDVIADLERLVDEQVVAKVEYKGDISYRNAAKWAKLSVHKSRIEIELNDLNQLELLQSETDRMSYALRRALTDLVLGEPEYAEKGVPVYELEQSLIAKDSEFFSRISFNVLLNRESRAGTVLKLPNGNYRLGPKGLASVASPAPSLSSCGSEESTLSSVGNPTKSAPSKFPPQSQAFRLALVTAGSKSPAMNNSPNGRSMSPMSLSPSAKDDLDPDPDTEMEISNNDPELSPSSSPVPAQNSELDDAAQDNENEPDLEADAEPEPETPSTSTSAANNPDASNTDSVETAEGGGYRGGERRKRAKKKVFDPSDNNMPKMKRRGRPASVPIKPPVNVAAHDENANKDKVEVPVQRPVPIVKPVPIMKPGPICSICSSEMKDKVVCCRDCTKKAHLTCLPKGAKPSVKSRAVPWQCANCKTCQSCLQTKEAGTMIVCSSCDDAYHVKCLTPRPKIPWKKWICQQCSPPEPKSSGSTPERSPSRGRGPPILLPMMTMSSLTASTGTDAFPDLSDYSIDESIPDATNWSSEEVYDYFKKLFPDHAAVFKDQDIDGRSLLLMTRNDVVKGLNLKLGPALKMYGQVKRLQIRRSERHLLWE